MESFFPPLGVQGKAASPACAAPCQPTAGVSAGTNESMTRSGGER